MYRSTLCAFTLLLGLPLATAGEPAAGPAPPAVLQLLSRDLSGAAGREVSMLTVEYPPGGSSPVHQHHAQVFVYVLSGTLRMQVKGGPLQTLHVGDTFYEGIDDIHTVSANASTSTPAKFLVVMVKDKESSR